MALNISELQLSGKSIAIVEDDIPSIKYYEILLKSSGADFSFFRTGKEFVDYLNVKHGNFDLVIMDFLVPLINGIDCLRFLRKVNKSVPVLMVTAYYSEQCKTEAYLAGCTEYILKPVYPEKILFLLDKYINREVSAVRTHL